jgi:hypothetical protein
VLDFIVLGIVPGTNFTITFVWSLVFGLIFAVLVLAYIELRKPNHKSTVSTTTDQAVELEAINPQGLLA